MKKGNKNAKKKLYPKGTMKKTHSSRKAQK